MLDDVDAVLGAFFTAAIPSQPVVHFEVGAKGAGKAPVLVLSLYRLAEEVDGVGNDWEDRRDHHGRVIARQRPPRRFCVTYLVDAEADTIAARHAVLGSALRAVIDYDEIPREHFVGAVDPDLPMLIRPAEVPERTNALMALQVVISLRPTPSTDIAPPAEELDLTMVRTEPPLEPVSPLAAVPSATGPADRKWRTYRVRETAQSRDA